MKKLLRHPKDWSGAINNLQLTKSGRLLVIERSAKGVLFPYFTW